MLLLPSPVGCGGCFVGVELLQSRHLFVEALLLFFFQFFELLSFPRRFYQFAALLLGVPFQQRQHLLSGELIGLELAVEATVRLKHGCR